MLSLKPMNCPGHVQIFGVGQRSYRELPMRMAEFGACHRYEPSGALHGLMRVRAFTQDDAHIFCREDQIVEETERFIRLTKMIHADLGMETKYIALATRPEIRAGSDAFWDKAEGMLAGAARTAGVTPVIAEGDRPSTPRSWTSSSRTPSAGSGPAAPCSSTTCCPNGSAPNVHRRGRLQAAARDAAPGDPRLVRAVHRHHDRELRRPLPDVAGPGRAVVTTIVSEADDYATEVTAAPRRRPAGRGRPAQRERSATRSASTASPRCRPSPWSAARRPRRKTKVAIRRLGSQDQTVVTVEEAIALLTAEDPPPDLR